MAKDIRDEGMKWRLGMAGVMRNRQRQGFRSIDGAIPHLCQKQIPIPSFSIKYVLYFLYLIFHHKLLR